VTEFNSQPVIEAVRKGKNQFFHNGSADSIEQAAELYFTVFNQTGGGYGRACALAGDRLNIPPPGAAVVGAGGTCVRIAGGAAVNVIAADFPTLADIKSEFGNNALNELGYGLRALSAFYSLADCERLVDETKFRIQNRLSTKQPVMHCGFSLSDVASVLTNARVKPLSPAYRRVAVASFGLKAQLTEAAATRNLYKLNAIKNTLKDLRKQIATTPDLL
jgi:hypothetical protein